MKRRIYTTDEIERMAASGQLRAEARVPLTASQHILHLLLTVFTGGLWAPVWFILAMRGNPRQSPPHAG